MGGASRNEKRRKQEAADRRLAAAGIRPPQRRRNRTPLVVVGVVLAVAVVIGVVVVVVQRSSGGTPPTYAAAVPTAVSGAVVSVGSGPVVVDVYEDYLCPICERFEERYGDEIAEAVNAGQITARFHNIAILDAATSPPGYSTRAANAALCAADAGIYPAYHHQLFAEQPAEQSSGLTDQQLVQFGTQLGASGDFAQCVTSGAHTDQVTAETAAAESNPALLTNGQFGTPTVAVGGQKIDLNDTSWLQNAIAP